jgi:diguanylate cyclase (GGDEF)-like protein/PAS domain S-box-containing protein
MSPASTDPKSAVLTVDRSPGSWPGDTGGEAPRALFWGAVALLLIILASTVFTLWRSRLDHQQRGEQHAQTLVRVLEEFVDSHIHEIDLVLQVASDEYRRLEGKSSAGKAYTEFLTSLQGRMPYLAALRAGDAQGNVQYGAGVDAHTWVNQSEREHFVRARDEGGLVIPRPVFARIAKQWVMPISRPLKHADGRFAGVVYASIPVKHLTAVFETLGIGKLGTVVLFDSQRSIMLRHPEPKGPGSAIGLKIGSPQFQALFNAGKDSATYQARSTTDGVWRTYAYSRVGDYPVYIMVGLSQQHILAEWYREVRVAGFFLAALLASVALLAMLLRRNWQQRSASLAALAARDSHLRQLMAESAVRERDLQAILDHLPAMVGYWDRSLHNRFANRPYHQVYGIEPGGMPGMHLRDVLGEDLLRASSGYIEAALRGEEQRFERTTAQPDGSNRHSLVHYIPDRVGDQVLGFYVLVSDVSDIKAAQAAVRQSEERYRRLFTDSRAPMLLIDPQDGAIVDCNRAATRYYGYDRERFCRMNIAAINQLPPDRVKQEMAQAVAEKRDFFIFPHRLAQGDIRQVEVRSGPIDIDGRHLLYSIIHDVTDRIEAEARLRLAASVFATSQEGIMVCDGDNHIVEINPAFAAITGYSRNEVLGRNPKLLSSGRHSSGFYAEMWRALNETGQWRGEIWNRRKSGEVYAQLLSITRVAAEHNEPLRYVGVFSDISPLKQHEAELDRIAHYDPLTGVPNRRLLTDRLEQAIARARRSRRNLAVCYLDLDGFKPINDQYGHEAGDHLLIEVARRLQEIMRADDTLARLGGDEFVLLLNDLEQEQESFRALDRVLSVVSLPIRLGDAQMELSASIGVALFPQDDADADSLLRHADQAMYWAKEAGKNRFHLYAAEQDQEHRSHQQFMQRLREAHAQGEFILHYQPKANLVTGDRKSVV